VDGYTLIRRVRTLDHPKKSEVAAVALTAYARLEGRTEAVRAAFQNHLPKPVEPAELLAVVHSLATPRSASRDAADRRIKLTGAQDSSANMRSSQGLSKMSAADKLSIGGQWLLRRAVPGWSAKTAEH
jgi:DNA-binding response OmpR family regulator